MCNAWYKEGYIKNETIKKSFLPEGISQKSDGTEDDNFAWPKEIEPEITMDNKYEIDKCDDCSYDFITE